MSGVRAKSFAKTAALSRVITELLKNSLRYFEKMKFNRSCFDPKNAWTSGSAISFFHMVYKILLSETFAAGSKNYKEYFSSRAILSLSRGKRSRAMLVIRSKNYQRVTVCVVLFRQNKSSRALRLLFVVRRSRSVKSFKNCVRLMIVQVFISARLA